MQKVCIQQPNVRIAVEKCLERNAIIMCKELGYGVSIHSFGNKLYYSDGRKIADTNHEACVCLEKDWGTSAKWFVIGYLEDYELSELERIHTSPKKDDSLFFKNEFNNFIGFLIYRDITGKN